MQMWSKASRQAKLTLVGASLIKFANGLALVWGSLNVYFFSYFKTIGEHIDSTTNSKLLLCTIIPLCLTVPLANPFSRWVGYKFAIRLFAFIFMLSPLGLNLWRGIEVFAVLQIVIPISCALMGGIPLLSCLWTQFPRDLSKVSSVAVVMISFGMIVWNLFFMNMVNPDNVKAVVDSEGIPVFPDSVAEKVIPTNNIVFIIAGLMNITGSFLVSKRETQSLLDPLEGGELSKTQSKPKTIVQGNIVQQIQRAVSSITFKSDKVKSLKHYLLDRRFILIFLISGLNPIYLVYLIINIKLIYMPILNDDHFLSYCVALVTISAVAAPLWGCFADSKGFRTTLLVVTAFDSLVKIFGVSCDTKLSLGLLFFLLGANDKGLLTIIGPGLIGMFGVETATELVPYKGLALLLAYILAPLMQIVIKTSNHNLLLVYFVFSIVGTVLSAYLKYYIHYEQIQADSEMRELQLLQTDKKINH